MEELLTQADARTEAKRLNDEHLVPDDLVAVAARYPLGAWGGQEQGWTVTYVPKEDSQ